MNRGRWLASVLMFSCVFTSFGFLAGQEESEDDPAKAARTQQQKMQRVMIGVMSHMAEPVAKMMTEHGDMLKSQIMADGENEKYAEYVGLDETQLGRRKTIREEFETDIQQVFMPVMLKAMTAETEDDFKSIAKDIDTKANDVLRSFSKKQDDLLTPAQKTKVAELNLQSNQGNIEAGPMSFRAYEILDLTESQREELQKIKQEYTDGFEKLIRKMLDVSMKVMTPEPGEENTAEKIEERAEKQQEEIKSLETEANQLYARTKARILALLSKEQREKFDSIIAKTPEFIKERIKSNDGEEDDEEWKKSWKPGDPVPKGKSAPRKAFPLMELAP